MPLSAPVLEERLSKLRRDLDAQGRAVQRLMETAVDAVFERDASRSRRVIEADEAIDKEDVRIEREAVQLLADASSHGAGWDAASVRLVMTIVKVNNELERIADSAVIIAERIEAFLDLKAALPTKFRVMANSVIGIMQTTNTALSQLDITAGQVVLASDDATEAFKQAILEDTLEELAAGKHTPAYALALMTVAANLGRMADHCTNIAEQVIYVASGKVVRHAGDKWTKPESID